MEGSRPILVEIQALVSSTTTGMPRRTTIGVDHQRTALLVAVLEKKVGLTLGCQDIFINVAGGVRIEEPAVDLGLAVAMASSFLDKAVPSRTVVVGEVGLAGEIRGIGQIETRLTEVRKLGFTRCILPSSNLSHLRQQADIELTGVKSVAQALEAALT
jgi:DNA repair protein RadA/Sms